MFTRVTLNVNEVQAGDVLAEDIFVEYRLLAKKDLVLTERIIELLKLRKVESLTVRLPVDSVRFVSDLDATRVKEYEDVFEPLLEKKVIDEYKEKVSKLFMITLENVVHELRYGQILKSMQDAAFVREIFEKY